MNIPYVAIGEIFHSIQGEGHLSGFDTLFVRFQGCHIGCKWCDTKYSWKVGNTKKWCSSKLSNYITGIVSKKTWVCFTGGEPLEQFTSLKFITEKLIKADYTRLSVETAGVISIDKKGIPLFPDVKDIYDMSESGVFFSVSPKLSSALGKRYSEEYINALVNFWTTSVGSPYRLQLKFVVSEDNDLYVVDSIYKRVNPDFHFCIQVEESKMNDKEFIQKCVTLSQTNPGLRLTIQMHKILGLK